MWENRRTKNISQASVWKFLKAGGYDFPYYMMAPVTVASF
jgi:hypothetical protein